jgi:hypothetical protein
VRKGMQHGYSGKMERKNTSTKTDEYGKVILKLMLGEYNVFGRGSLGKG